MWVAALSSLVRLVSSSSCNRLNGFIGARFVIRYVCVTGLLVSLMLLSLLVNASVVCIRVLILLYPVVRDGLYVKLLILWTLVCGHGRLGSYRLILNSAALWVTIVTNLRCVLILTIWVSAFTLNSRLLLFILRLCLTSIILNRGLGFLSSLLSTCRHCGLNSCSFRGTRGSSIELRGNTGSIAIALYKYWTVVGVTGLCAY